MNMKNALLIIDPQKDFIETPKFKGSLAVPGAYDDMRRLAQYVEAQTPDAIVVTMDTHARMHIANPMWWVNEKGENPNPFTLISVEDVDGGLWKAADSAKQEHALHYVKELAKQGRYVLCIWPYHCIEGTEGHEISEVLMPTLKSWEEKTGKQVRYIFKGQNPDTEMYSGFKAEVVIHSDPRTALNQKEIDYLASFETVKIAGEAKSHCVASTGEDLINAFGEKANRIEFLENCMSSVPGFESNGKNFVELARSRGCVVRCVPDVSARRIKMA